MPTSPAQAEGFFVLCSHGVEAMWEIIQEHFEGRPAQARVARALVDYGLRVMRGQICCDKIRISAPAVARALGVDRRIVYRTLRTIARDRKLATIYARLSPTCNLKDVAGQMGWGVVEIQLADPAKPGVLGAIATRIGAAGVSIRQAVGEDPTYASGQLFIITETPVPGEVLSALTKISGVTRITVYHR